MLVLGWKELSKSMQLVQYIYSSFNLNANYAGNMYMQYINDSLWFIYTSHQPVLKNGHVLWKPLTVLGFLCMFLHETASSTRPAPLPQVGIEFFSVCWWYSQKLHQITCTDADPYSRSSYRPRLGGGFGFEDFLFFCPLLGEIYPMCPIF